MSERDTGAYEEEAAALAPYADFSAAARAVFGKLSSVEDAPLGDVLVRLLGTVLSTEKQLADERERAARAELDSLIDPLTDLGNRRAWIRLLAREDERCQRHGIPANVIIVDLDDLKATNDAAGHAAGDEVLRRAARTIVAHVRKHDSVARLGGDEFGILATHCPRADADLLAFRIHEALSGENISASIGLAERHPNHGLQRAWEEADAAMYERKRSRRSDRAQITTAQKDGT